MPTQEFAAQLKANPRAFGKATTWKDMSPKERAIRMAGLEEERQNFHNYRGLAQRIKKERI